MLAENDPDPAVRAACTAGLGSYVFEGEVDELPKTIQRTIEEKLLSIFQGSDDVLVRRRALEALGYSSREDVPPLIEEAYNSGSQDWLLSSLVAMGRSCNPDFESMLLLKLKDARASVRAEAAYAAGEMLLKSAVPTLLELLKDDEELVRAAVIWALGETGGEGVREALEKVLDKTDDDEEAELIDTALENLAFVEDMGIIPLVDISEPGDDDWIELDLGDDKVELDEEE
jgi:HEAT repeat protein